MTAPAPAQTPAQAPAQALPRTLDLRTDAPARGEEREAYVTVLEGLTYGLVASERMRDAYLLQNALAWFAVLLTAFAALMQQLGVFRWSGPAALLTCLAAIGLSAWISRRAQRRIRETIGEPIEDVSVRVEGRAITALLRAPSGQGLAPRSTVPGAP